MGRIRERIKNKFRCRVENRLNSLLDTPPDRLGRVPESTVDEVIADAKRVIEYDPKKNRAKGTEDGIKGVVVGIIVSLVMGVFERWVGDIGANNETAVALTIALVISYFFSYVSRRILNRNKIRKLQGGP